MTLTSPRSVERTDAASHPAVATTLGSPRPALGGTPHVLELGVAQHAKRIQKALEARGVRVQRHVRPGDVREVASSASRALVLVPPIPDISVARYCQAFTSEHPEIPVFVTLHGTLSRKRQRTLYDSGVQAVFQWPAESKPLVRTAFRLAGPTAAATASARDGGDVALEELVNAHLRTAGADVGDGLFARVHHRYAILDGSVDALWKVHLAEQVIAEVPGVEEVVADSVAVHGLDRSDREIAQAIRQLLRHATEVDPSTIAVHVEDGRVVLSGTTGNRREVQRALGLIRHVRGVRAIDNYLTISSTAKKQDRRLAGRVREALEIHAPRSSVEAAVFGRIAVLSGRVSSASERSAIVRLIEAQQGVDRVVDKLVVRSRRQRAPERAPR